MTRFMHTFHRKNKVSINYTSLWENGPIWATVWAPVQEKVAVTCIFIKLDV